MPSVHWTWEIPYKWNSINFYYSWASFQYAQSWGGFPFPRRKNLITLRTVFFFFNNIFNFLYALIRLDIFAILVIFYASNFLDLITFLHWRLVHNSMQHIRHPPFVQQSTEYYFNKNGRKKANFLSFCRFRLQTFNRRLDPLRHIHLFN